MKRKLLIVVIVLFIVIIFLLNSFAKVKSNKYLGNIPIFIVEMQEKKNKIEVELSGCLTEKCNEVLKEEINEINVKYSDDLFKNEFEKVKNKEIACDVTEGLPIKVIFLPKFTNIDKNKCLTLQGILIATEDIEIDSNNNLIYLKYLDKKGDVIDIAVSQYTLKNQVIRKKNILAGEEIDIKLSECIDPKKAMSWINFEKIVIITEKEYNNIKNKLFD